MPMHRCIPLASPAEWREALNGIRHAFAHTWESCYAMHLTTGFATYLYCFEDGETRIVCPLSERQYEGHVDIVTPYGFSGFIGNSDCPAFPREWTRFARERGYVCGYIQLNPLLENHTYFSSDEITARLDRGRRKQIQAIANGPAHLVFDCQALRRFFLEQTAAFFHRKNAARLYQFSEDTLSFLASAENVALVGAGAPEQVEAVALTAYTPYIGEAFLQISRPGGERYAAELVWERLKFLKSRQIPWMNLGGGVTEHDGVAAFKARFGTTRLALGCLKQVYNPSAYALLCRQAGREPTDLSGYFPPYHDPRARESAHV